MHPDKSLMQPPWHAHPDAVKSLSVGVSAEEPQLASEKTPSPSDRRVATSCSFSCHQHPGLPISILFYEVSGGPGGVAHTGAGGDKRRGGDIGGSKVELALATASWGHICLSELQEGQWRGFKKVMFAKNVVFYMLASFHVSGRKGRRTEE